MRHTTFSGGVFSDSLPNGRAGVDIGVDSQAISATTVEGQTFSIALAEVQVERGGASGDMLFFRNPDRSMTIFTEDAGILAAFERSGSVRGRQAISSVKTQFAQRKTRRTIGWGLVIAVGVAAVGGLLWGIQDLMSKPRDLIPYSVDQHIGDFSIEHMDMGGPIVTIPAVTTALKTMLDRLEPHVTGPETTFNLRVVDSPQANAFALPGGHIVVFTGLIRKAKTPEQVAGVLAHEMAHVTERHGIERMAQSIGLVAVIQLILGDMTGIGQIAGELLTVAAINSYSRGQESEADAVAVQTMQGAELDPRALASFFQLLADESHTKTADGESDDRGEELEEVFSWMSTHPGHQDRIASIEKIVDTQVAKRSTSLPIDWAAVQASLAKAPTQDPKEPRP